MSALPVRRDPPLQLRHWLRGLAALAIGLTFGIALPASARRIWPAPVAGGPGMGTDLPDGTQLRSLAPGSVEVLPGAEGVIYAGLPGETPVSDAATPNPDPVPQTALPERRIAPPDIKRAWLVTSLPAEVPRQDYSGWVTILVDDQGRVADAVISTSSGNATVDAETLARLSRERLNPAIETLLDGTEVPIPYSGRWFFRWVLLRPQ